MKTFLLNISLIAMMLLVSTSHGRRCGWNADTKFSKESFRDLSHSLLHRAVSHNVEHGVVEWKRNHRPISDPRIAG
ncbi:hypothetical protein Q1695_002523 [Nippostrongylus brasiliensis]|nr:hypothetical protein Q1695_002523 [Nippostrongylus brasiliensis]